MTCLNEVSLDLPPAATILHRLRAHAIDRPEHIAFQEADRGLQIVREITYGELWQRAANGAAALRRVAQPGDRVVIFFEPGIEPIIAFLAALAARMIAVPAALPPLASLAMEQRKPGAGRRADAAHNIVLDCAPRLILASAASQPKVAAVLNSMADAPVLLDYGRVSQAESAGAKFSEDDLPLAEEIAFLQYTSGSTSLPKGVVVTHANIMHNQLGIARFVRSNPRSVFVSWLPLFHDMGLVGDTLHPIWAGCPCVKLAPSDFLRRPHLWMEAVSKFGGTITGGPNFAFQLAVAHAAAAPGALDLSKLEIIYCGSEPVRAGALDAFAAAYESRGLRAHALTPCYGLAESTLIVTGLKGDEGFRSSALPGPAAAGGFAQGAPARMVSCGRVACPDTEIFIADPATGAAPPKPGAIGEIAVRSRSISPGYWRDLAATKPRLFPDAPRVLRTGDVGFIHEGELYVSGRLKNTLIVRGRKFIAEDVESLIERELHFLQRARAIVFPVATPRGEAVVALVESAAALPEDEARARDCVARALSEMCGFVPDHIAFVRPSSLPRTTSGKLQRQFAAELWFANRLPHQIAAPSLS